MILSPNQQVIKDSHTGKLYCHEVDAEDYTCWKDGILVFKDQTLAEISTILERRFNVRIEIDSESIKYDKYVASFRKHVSLDDILKSYLINAHGHIFRRMENQASQERLILKLICL